MTMILEPGARFNKHSSTLREIGRCLESMIFSENLFI